MPISMTGVEGPSVSRTPSVGETQGVEPVSAVAPAAPEGEGQGGHEPGSPQYFSPVIRLDNESGLAVIHFRDDQSGETELQFPPEKVVKEYRQQHYDRSSASPEEAAARPDAAAAAGRAELSGAESGASATSSAASGVGAIAGISVNA